MDLNDAVDSVDVQTGIQVHDPNARCKSRVKCDKGPCEHYLSSAAKGDAGFCSLPGEFRCMESVRAKAPRLSHSSVQNFLRCKRYYWYRDVRGIGVKPHMMSRAVKMGGVWDKVQDVLMGCGKNSAVAEYIKKNRVDPVDAAKVRAVYRAYKELEITKNMDGFIGTQAHFDYHHWDTEAGDVLIHGFYDALYTDHFVECKFSSRPENYLNAWNLTSQVGTYFLANNDMKYCVMEVVRAPQPRKTKTKGEDETPEELENRVLGDILSRPTNFFQGWDRNKRTYGIKFYRSDFDLKELRDRYTHIVREIKEAAARGAWYRNNTACYMYGNDCDYKPICETGYASDLLFEIRKQANQIIAINQ